MSEIRNMRSFYEARLKEMKANNKNIDTMRDKQRLLQDDLFHCRSTIRNIKSTYESLQGKNKTYIEDIISNLEASVEYAVNSVLPIKKYQVTIEYRPNRNRGTLKLYFINEKGEKLPPRIIEGDMLNQVLSFASVTHITVQMGYDTIFFDEAFSSANVRSLALINSVISYYTKLGVKFVFVTQNPMLYAGLERCMIELVSDGIQIVDVQKSIVQPDVGEQEVALKVTDLFDAITKTKE